MIIKNFKFGFWIQYSVAQSLLWSFIFFLSKNSKNRASCQREKQFLIILLFFNLKKNIRKQPYYAIFIESLFRFVDDIVGLFIKLSTETENRHLSFPKTPKKINLGYLPHRHQMSSYLVNLSRLKLFKSFPNFDHFLFEPTGNQIQEIKFSLRTNSIHVSLSFASTFGEEIERHVKKAGKSYN